MVRSIEKDEPPPVSVARPVRMPTAVMPAMSNSPEPMKVLEVGQWTRAAPDSAMRAFSRGVRWMAWPKSAPSPRRPCAS